MSDAEWLLTLRRAKGYALNADAEEELAHFVRTSGLPAQGGSDVR